MIRVDSSPIAWKLEAMLREMNRATDGLLNADRTTGGTSQQRWAARAVQ